MRIELAVASHDRRVHSGSARFLAAALAAGAAISLVAFLAHEAWPQPSGDLIGLAAILSLAVPFGFAAWRISLSGAAELDRRARDTVPVSAIDDAVVWLDASGDVVRTGPSRETLFGASSRELRGRGLFGRVHVADRPAFLKAVSDASHGTAGGPATIRVQAGENGALPARGFAWIEMRVHQLRGRDAGDPSTVLAFLRDVSAERLHAEELDHARRDAERASQMKDRFLATVSHELRTPLNAIIGFSELLSADHPFLLTEERRKEYATIIGSSGHHLLEIVNTLLDMSKIESGNFQFDPEGFDFTDLATSCCDLIQLKADQAEVTVARSFATELPEIKGDRRACRQILINLVSNAVKFTPAGGMVTVSVAAGGGELVVSVADTGIGVPEADLPRLGDPFFQSGDIHRRNHEGTGLGLSVVRGLVGLHRGRMAIESGAGMGTSVTVWLPLGSEAGTAPPRPVAVQTRALMAPRSAERKFA